MPGEDLAWADLSASGDPALVTWLEGASCDPHVKALVVRAVHASERRVSAARWRSEVLASPRSGALAGQGPAGPYMSRDDARQETARILAHDQGGWLT